MTEKFEWSMMFDAKMERLDGAIRRVEHLDRRIGYVERDSKKAGSALSKASKDGERDWTGFGKKMEEISKWVKGLTLFEVGKWGLGKLASGVRGLVGEVKELVNVGAREERSRTVFANVFGEDAEATLEYAEKFAKASEFLDDEVRPMLLSLARVGIEGDDAAKALSAASDMAARMDGDPVESANRVLAAIEKIYRTGKIEGRTLAAFGFSPKALVGDLAEITGKSKEAVAKGLKKGDLDVSMSLEALYAMVMKHTGQKLGASGDVMSRTMGAKLKKLSDLPEEFMKKFERTEGFEAIKKAIDSILVRFDPESSTGKAIDSFMQRVGNSFSEWVEGGGIERALDKVESFFKRAVGFAETLIGALDKVRAAYDWIAGNKPEGAPSRMDDIYNAVLGDKGLAQYQPAAPGMQGQLVAATAAGSINPMASKDSLLASAIWADKGLSPNATGGLVTGVRGGMALVSAAPGEGLASVGAGERIVPAGGLGLRGITVNIMPGAVQVHVLEPGASAADVGEAVRDQLPAGVLAGFERLSLEFG